MRGDGNAERKSDGAKEGARVGEEKERAKESSSTGFLRAASGERMKMAAGRGPLWRWRGGLLVLRTLTLVQLVLFHDVVLQLRAQVLLLLLDGAGLPAVLLVQLPSQPESTSTSSSSTPPGPPVRVHVVAQDGGLDQLRGGIGRGLAARPHKAAFLQVGTVEGLHLIDLVGQIHVSVEPRLRHGEIGLLVLHLVVIIGDAVGWRT